MQTPAKFSDVLVLFYVAPPIPLCSRKYSEYYPHSPDTLANNEPKLKDRNPRVNTKTCRGYPSGKANKL